jgi:hypothetical protein
VSAKFDPLRSPVQNGKGGAITTTVTFTEPGEYVVRALADDGALFGTSEVTIRVTAK